MPPHTFEMGIKGFRYKIKAAISDAVVLKPKHASESPGGQVKTQVAGAALRVSDSEGPEQGLRTCISVKFNG